MASTTMLSRTVAPSVKDAGRLSSTASISGAKPVWFPAQSSVRPAGRKEASTVVARTSFQKRAQKGLDRAKDVALEDRNPEGNSNAYAALALAFGGTAAVFAAAPHVAADLIFGADALPHDYLHEALFRILATGFLTAGVTSWVQKTAADEGELQEVLHRRLNAALTAFGTSTIGLQLLDLVALNIVNPAAALFLGGTAGATALVAGTNFAKNSPEGTNVQAAARNYPASDVKNVQKVDGAISAIYALLSANFVAAGFAYLVAPAATLNAVFGMAAGKGPEDIFLWQLIGGGLITLVGPVAYSLKEAANNNNFSDPRNRLLNFGLAGASLGHVAALTPLLGTEQAGPFLPALLGVWVTSAITSTLITAKPK